MMGGDYCLQERRSCYRAYCLIAYYTGIDGSRKYLPALIKRSLVRWLFGVNRVLAMVRLMIVCGWLLNQQVRGNYVGAVLHNVVVESADRFEM